MNNIDIAILVVLGIAAFNGWRRGLVVSIFSIVGAGLGVYIGNGMVSQFVSSSSTDVVKVGTIVGGLLIFASLGSSIGSFIGRRLRSIYKWTPLGLVDNFGGLLLSLAIWVIIVWTAFHFLDEIPNWKLHAKYKDSGILELLNTNIPQSVVNFVDNVLKPQELVGKLWERLN